MALFDTERQQRCRERKEAQGAKRYQIMLPQSAAEQVRELTDTLGCTKAELFTRLIAEELRRVKVSRSPAYSPLA
jgi:hypothetical protein